MAGSMEDGQTACMGEIQTNSVPLSPPTEEHSIQQDKQDQSCNESDLLTKVELELQEQTQEHDKSGEKSKYEEQLQLPEQPEKWSEPEEQSPYLMSGFEGVPTNTEGISLELCWYCVKSLPNEELKLSQVLSGFWSMVEFITLQLENEALTSANGGERLSYQLDPRPHFGVARSSRSTPFPLWDSEGPREMKREAGEEDADFVASCPHCHLGLPLDTLRWHEEKCLLFEGPKKDA